MKTKIERDPVVEVIWIVGAALIVINAPALALAVVAAVVAGALITLVKENM